MPIELDLVRYYLDSGFTELVGFKLETPTGVPVDELVTVTLRRPEGTVMLRTALNLRNPSGRIDLPCAIVGGVEFGLSPNAVIRTQVASALPAFSLWF